MKKLFKPLLLLLPFAFHSLAQPNATDYYNKCVSCVLADPTFYYCTKNNQCVGTFVDNQSCEQGLQTCLNYKSTDLGVKEIPPFTSTRSSFNYTLREGNSIRFAISNQDSKVKGWFKLMLKTAPASDDHTYPQATDVEREHIDITDLKHDILDAVPAGVKLYYFDQNTGNMVPDYVYSKAGKAYLKPLNTRFLFVATNSSDVTVQVMYGNTMKHAELLKSAIYGVALLLCSVMFIY